MLVHEWISYSAEDTFNLGRQLGATLEAGDFVAFQGDLGAGKTCCIQGIASGLGVANRSLVTSPTFTLIQEYQGRLPIYHFDVYRLAQEEDLYDLGYEEYFYGEGVTLLEWAERIPHFLPDERLTLHLHIQADQTRQIQLFMTPQLHPAKTRLFSL
jgi:tRNA threonylcarbamoyladenosine biosynthesis protein TsaE